MNLTRALMMLVIICVVLACITADATILRYGVQAVVGLLECLPWRRGQGRPQTLCQACKTLQRAVHAAPTMF